MRVVLPGRAERVEDDFVVRVRPPGAPLGEFAEELVSGARVRRLLGRAFAGDLARRSLTADLDALPRWVERGNCEEDLVETMTTMPSCMAEMDSIGTPACPTVPRFVSEHCYSARARAATSTDRGIDAACVLQEGELLRRVV